jgi:hypothetical protein
MTGYEVHRFGGAELSSDDLDAESRLQRFCREQFDRHHVRR